VQDVRDFAERKGHLDDQLAQARAELAWERKEHEDKLGELERHAVQVSRTLRSWTLAAWSRTYVCQALVR
jgi:N-acetyl-beta-hexosaminidase